MTEKKSVSVKKKTKQKKTWKIYSIIFAKLIVIGLLIYGFLFLTSSHSNTISLLAVSEDETGQLRGGSIIDLTLEIKPGSGQIYVNSNTVKETDTQVTLIKAHSIACNIFNLNCENYDFFFTFSGTNSILKGPSASAGIAILTATTVNKQTLNSNIAITGSLNSGGVIGNVGGVSEKILVARNRGFDAVIIPTFSQVNRSEFPSGIEVFESIDIIHAYNIFSNRHFSLRENNIQTEEYHLQMRELAESLCLRAENFINQLERFNVTNESEQYLRIQRGMQAYQNAMTSINISNYYSAGSFCFNANNNLHTALLFLENRSQELLNAELNNLQVLIRAKEEELLTQRYIQSINTMNDFYVFMLLNDRVFESQRIIRQFRESVDENNLTEEEILGQLITTLALAQERFNTALLWESLIRGTGSEITFTNSDIRNACNTVLEEIRLTNQLLIQQGVNDIFASEIRDLNQIRLTNNYLCIYKGVQLQARMNHLLNSIGISANQIDSFAQTMIEITRSRLSLLEEDSFPLIPFIYYEFSSDLLESDPLSSILYAHYSLAFTDMYLIFQKDQQSLWSRFHHEFFSNPLVYIGLLLILGFM